MPNWSWNCGLEALKKRQIEACSADRGGIDQAEPHRAQVRADRVFV